MSWWVTFKDGTEGCIGFGNLPDTIKMGDDLQQAAREVAETLRGPVQLIQVLPYNANPMVSSYQGCMPMCYTPKECKGHSSCPKRRACSE